MSLSIRALLDEAPVEVAEESTEADAEVADAE